MADSILGPPDPPTAHMWGVGGAGPGIPAADYQRVIERRAESREWLTRRVGYVQGRVVGQGYELGLESEMPDAAQVVVKQALAEFAERWPDPLASREEEQG